MKTIIGYRVKVNDGHYVHPCSLCAPDKPCLGYISDTKPEVFGKIRAKYLRDEYRKRGDQARLVRVIAKPKPLKKKFLVTIQRTTVDDRYVEITANDQQEARQRVLDKYYAKELEDFWANKKETIDPYIIIEINKKT